MATYLAPGVYVEEVPAGQQAIPGVGTNTAAFIGFVPDETEHPVPNEDYDPQFAAAVAQGGEQVGETLQKRKDERSAELSSQKSTLEEEITQLSSEQSELQRQLDAIDVDAAPDNEKDNLKKQSRNFARQITRKGNAIDSKKEEIRRLDTELEAITGAGESEGKIKGVLTAILKPYSLQKQPTSAPPFEAKLCTNFGEYKARFGNFSADEEDKVGVAKHPGHRALSHAVSGFFMNGGTRCFVLRIPKNEAGDVSTDDVGRALQVIESIDAVAIVAMPGIEGNEFWQKLYAHCDTTSDRFAILDCPADVEDDAGSVDVTKLSYDSNANILPPTNKNAAFYFPQIQVSDPAKQMQDADPARGVAPRDRGRVHTAPSGHMAGIYARVDEQRGVHKAPANEPVRGALGVRYYIGRPRQELLNPQGVNCIRDMNGNIRAWGARTIGGDKNGEWKYLSVRRLFLYLRESIDEGTQWVVFEPNDPALWGKIRRNVTAFLRNVWRDGALFGNTPEEAFYVKCDAETNPASLRELGQVVTEIGVSIVRPAEFVIFRVTQWSGPNEG